jgi:hypothetical protein
MSAVIERTESKVDNYHQLECQVTLSDLEQIVIKAPKYAGYKLVNGSWVANQPELRKYRVTRLFYSLTEDKDNPNGVIKIHRIDGNYFNKGSNRIGVRTTWLNPTKEVIEQLPDSIHDRARANFQNVVTPLLQSVLEKGLVIGEYTNA